MLSLRHRKEGFVASALCLCAFFAIFVGVISSIISVGATPKNQERAALHYIDKARQLGHSIPQAHSLYQLSEQSMISAIIADPYDSKRWQILSDVLFTLGKDQSALMAQKIANRLKPSKNNITLTALPSSPKLDFAMAELKQQ